MFLTVYGGNDGLRLFFFDEYTLSLCIENDGLLPCRLLEGCLKVVHTHNVYFSVKIQVCEGVFFLS